MKYPVPTEEKQAEILQMLKDANVLNADEELRNVMLNLQSLKGETASKVLALIGKKFMVVDDYAYLLNDAALWLTAVTHNKPLTLLDDYSTRDGNIQKIIDEHRNCDAVLMDAGLCGQFSGAHLIELLRQKGADVLYIGASMDTDNKNFQRLGIPQAGKIKDLSSIVRLAEILYQEEQAKAKESER